MNGSMGSLEFDLNASVGSVILQALAILALDSIGEERKLVNFLFENLEHLYAKYLFKEMCSSSIYPLYPTTYDLIVELGDQLNKSSNNFNLTAAIEVCRDERELNKVLTVVSNQNERCSLRQVANVRNGYLREEELALPPTWLSIVIGQWPARDKTFSDSSYVIMRSKPLERFPSPMEYSEMTCSIELSYHTSFSDVDNDEPENVKVIQVSSETAAMLLNSRV
jgi:hypothetical protein